MDLNLRQVRAFVAVARLGSFTRAAALLHVAQPTLTVQIRRLEEALTVRLFDRTSRSVALTQIGRDLLPVLARLVQDLDGIIAEVRNHGAGYQGLVRVAALPTAAAAMLPKAIASFRIPHPGADFRIRDVIARRVLALVDAEEVDIGVTGGRTNAVDVDVLLTIEDRMHVVFPQTHALAETQLVTPELLMRYPLIMMDPDTSVRAVVEAAIKAGAKSAYVVKEPILAAIGAGIPIQEARGHMVVDIGGGTTDVAVISLGGIVASTSVKCAGNRIDAAIADYIKKTFNLAIGDKTAEDIKINIGSAVPLEEELSMIIKGRDFISGLPRSTEIKTNEIVKAIARELRDMVKAIKDVLQETPPELSADIIDHGIIMTGGSSMLRNLPELVFRRTGVKAILADDALYCVAKGTGIALEHLDVYKKTIIAKR